MSLALKNTRTILGINTQSDLKLRDAQPGIANLVFNPVLSETNPLFTTGHIIPLSAHAQGVWLKVINLTAGGLERGVTINSDNFVVEHDGIYEVSLSSIIEQGDGNNRNVAFGFSVNTGALTLPVGSVQAHGGTLLTTNGGDVSLSGIKHLQLSANATVSLYFIAVRTVGTVTIDLTARYLNFSIRRLTGCLSTEEI